MTEAEYIQAIKEAAKAHMAEITGQSGSCMATRRRLDDMLSFISPRVLEAMCEAWLEKNRAGLDGEGKAGQR